MDPIAKLKAKFTPLTMLRQPSVSENKASQGSASPFKRPRLLPPSTAMLHEARMEESGPSQPPSHALVLGRRRSGATRSLDSSTFQADGLSAEPQAMVSATTESRSRAAALPDASEGPFYLCTWRKPQFRKHKTWDGDALLIVKNQGQSCSLRCADTGKELSSQATFNHGPLESGDQLTIGGKEIEIDRQITRQEYLKGPSAGATAAAPHTPARVAKPFKSVVRTSNVPSSKPTAVDETDLKQLGPAKASTFYAKPTASAPDRPSPVRASGLMNPGQGKVPHARFDPEAEGAIVMRRPDEDHQKRFNVKNRPVVDVVIDPQLAKALRPHQVEGVKFLYERVMGMHARGLKGHGAILADEMGLGKTLQTITLILTLMKQNCYYTSASCTIERALIVCPLSLVKNWKREFRKWIGNNALNVLCIDDGKGKEEVRRFVRSKAYQVLVIGYEKLRTCVEILKEAQPPIGLIVCDEGHRLKSRDAKTTLMFQQLSTPRRIILSGTPIQNDLSEFFAMIDFVVPGLLGTYAAFKQIFEDPMIKARAQHCAKAVRELGESRNESLVKVTHDIILRRTADLLAQYLQPKHEMVLFCSPSTLQLSIYRSILNSSAVRSVLRGEAGNGLVQIGILRKLCNTPELLLKDLESEADSATKAILGDALSLFPERRRRYEAAYSGKLACAVNLLQTIKETTDDRVVFVSNFTNTLDIMEGVLRKLRFKYVRLDGQTPQDERMNLVNNFNRKETSTFVFLLSAKSGGVGLNLIGANRLILFDSDWNPSTDQQAMARIHRDGQRKPCFIYRLLLSGTMDEKIYQRQLSKLALSDALMNAGQAGSSKRSSDAFSQEELLDIFTLHTDTACLSHKQLACDCDGKGGGSESAKRARIEALAVSERSDGSDGDDEDEDDDDDELPGFVAASQHIADAATTASKDRRAKLAALHDWAHFDCFQHPEHFKGDTIISQLLPDNTSAASSKRTLGSNTAATPETVSAVKEEADGAALEQGIVGQRTRRLVDQLDGPEFAQFCRAARDDPSNQARIAVEAETEEAGGENALQVPLDLLEEASRFDIERVPPGRILFAFAKSSISLGMGTDVDDVERGRIEEE